MVIPSAITSAHISANRSVAPGRKRKMRHFKADSSQFDHNCQLNRARLRQQEPVMGAKRLVIYL